MSGLIASQIGGVMMAILFFAAFPILYGARFFYPLDVIGSYLYGEPALSSGLGTLGRLWALCFHVGICAVWGVVFGLIAPLLRVDKSYLGSLALGLVIGLASQLVDINLVTPPLMRALHGQDLWAMGMPTWLSWVGHIWFGLSFVAFAPIFRRLWLKFVGRDDVYWNDARIR